MKFKTTIFLFAIGAMTFSGCFSPRVTISPEAAIKQSNESWAKIIRAGYPTMYTTYHNHSTTKDFAENRGIVEFKNGEYSIEYRNIATNQLREKRVYSDEKLTIPTGTWTEYNDEGAPEDIVIHDSETKSYERTLYRNKYVLFKESCKDKDCVTVYLDSISGKTISKIFKSEGVKVRSITYDANERKLTESVYDTTANGKKQKAFVTKGFRADQSVIYEANFLDTAYTAIACFDTKNKPCNCKTLTADDAKAVAKLSEKPNERRPEYPGGEAALMTFLANNVTYPIQSREAGIEGKVFLCFIVEKDGSVKHVAPVRFPDLYTAREAIRVVKRMLTWNPGEQNGKKVRVLYTLPIQFKLD